ncbi:purine and uridine phosphorylase [Trichoderma austrokoningii]
MSPKRLTSDSYRLGWICPSNLDLIAAWEMLDEEHMPIDQPLADNNVYKLGSINGHNVVITGLHERGNCIAASVATQMRVTFKNLTHGLLVGTGGGVPVETDEGMIRLGHVVVSKPDRGQSGVVQFDHGKEEVGAFERTAHVMPPPAVLLNAAQALAVQRDRMDHDPVWKDTLRLRTERRGLRRFEFPGIENDCLYLPDYEHQQKGVSCEKAGCSPEQRIARPVDELDDDEAFVVVHRGNVASGELSLRNAKQRDSLAKQHGVLCFETEAAGALVDLPCLVIRGISNYCDSHENDIWDGFAAAAAAAYARQLFFHLPIHSIPETVNSQSTPTAFSLPFYMPEKSRSSQFIAREEELRKMQEALRGAAQLRRVVTIQGCEGSGTTQLVIEYAQRHREDYSAIVWVDARDETAINQSFARLARWILNNDPSANDVSDAVESKNQAKIVEAVKKWFDEPVNNSWLIIYDNYWRIDPSLVGTKGHNTSLVLKEDVEGINPISPTKGAATETFDLREYLPETDHGAVVVISPASLGELGDVIHIGEFEHLKDSIAILASASYREYIKQDEAAANLARKLVGLPLALVSAGAYLKQVAMTCAEYLQLYEKARIQLHEAYPRLSAEENALYTVWNISYAHIEQQNAHAALLLRQWAYFDSKDLWYELLQDGESYKPVWLAEATRDDLTFHSLMSFLSSYGLVQTNMPNTPDTMEHAESDGYSVHAMVHSWMTRILNQEYREDMARAALHSVASHAPDEEQPELWWSKQRRLLKHAQRGISAAKTMAIEKEEIGLLHALAAIFAGQDRFSEAEAMFTRSIRELEKACGPDAGSTLTTVYNLAGLYRYQGRLFMAEDLYKRALRGFEKVQQVDDSAIELRLDCLVNLGDICSEHGRMQAARQYYQRAHEDLLGVLGADSQDVVWLSQRLEEIRL